MITPDTSRRTLTRHEAVGHNIVAGNVDVADHVSQPGRSPLHPFLQPLRCKQPPVIRTTSRKARSRKLIAFLCNPVELLNQVASLVLEIRTSVWEFGRFALLCDRYAKQSGNQNRPKCERVSHVLLLPTTASTFGQLFANPVN